MSKLQKAFELYAENKQDFFRELSIYFQHGYVFSDPISLILYKPVKIDSADPINEWVKPEDADAWYVHFAYGKGCIKKLCDQIPFRLPYFGYSRALKNKPIKYYKSEKFFRRLK